MPAIMSRFQIVWSLLHWFTHLPSSSSLSERGECPPLCCMPTKLLSLVLFPPDDKLKIIGSPAMTAVVGPSNVLLLCGSRRQHILPGSDYAWRLDCGNFPKLLTLCFTNIRRKLWRVSTNVLRMLVLMTSCRVNKIYCRSDITCRASYHMQVFQGINMGAFFHFFPTYSAEVR